MGVQLKSIGEVFTETWGLYRQRAVPILAVILLSSFLVIFLVFVSVLIAVFVLGIGQVPGGRLDVVQSGPAVLIMGLAALLVTTIVIIWSQAATVVVSVDENISVTAALRAGWKYFIPLAWVGTLYMGIVLTGLSLFLVPGLILGLSLSLCFYVLVDEDLHGLDAVLASHQYMRGHWWNTFVKFSLVWLISVALNLVPLVGQLVSFIFSPFLLLFMVVVYRDLKEASGELTLHPGSRWLWGIMAAVGCLIPVLGLLGGMVTLGPQLPGLIRQIQDGNIAGRELPEIDGLPISPGRMQKHPSPEVRRLQSVDGSWVWRDPIGDVSNRLLDIKEVSAKAEQRQLVLGVTLARPVFHYYLSVDEAVFAPLLSFYLDTDVNRETGGRAMPDAGRSGYDVAIDVLLEARPDEADRGLVHVGLYAVDGRERKWMATGEKIIATVSGKTLKIRLPYELLAIASGDKLRLCYRETAQQQGSSLAKDKLIPIN